MGYFGPRNDDVEDQALLGGEAEIGVAQAGEAAHQPAGAGDEHDRERDLDDRHHAQPARRAASAGRRARALVHQRAHVGAGQPQRRREADEQPADDERGEREQQHAPVEGDGVEPRQFRRAEREQRADADEGEQQAEHRAGRRQQRRFGQQLPDDAAARRAEGDAHRHLARPRGAAREQQVGDVDAAEQEQQPRRRHHDDQDRPEVADDRGDERLGDVDAIQVGRREVARESVHDRRHLRVGALQRHAGLQPHEAVEEVIDVVLVELLAEPEVAAVRRVEVARRDAGDRRRDFREPDRLADDRRIAAVEVLPDAIRDHDDRRRGRRSRGRCRAGRRPAGRGRRWRRRGHEVLVREAAERHRQTEQLEEPFGDAVDLHVLRRAVVVQQRQVRRLHAGGADDRQVVPFSREISPFDSMPVVTRPSVSVVRML